LATYTPIVYMNVSIGYMFKATNTTRTLRH
jgi:hypothetical protein